MQFAYHQLANKSTLKLNWILVRNWTLRLALRLIYKLSVLLLGNCPNEWTLFFFFEMICCIWSRFCSIFYLDIRFAVIGIELVVFQTNRLRSKSPHKLSSWLFYLVIQYSRKSIDLEHRVQVDLAVVFGVKGNGMIHFDWMMRIGDIGSFYQNISNVGTYLSHCLSYAVDRVPVTNRLATPIFFGATAGLRLLKYSFLCYDS